MKRTIYILTAFLIISLVQTFGQDSSSVVTLKQCIEAAFTNNPVIKEAGNEASISAIGIKTAQSGLYPVVSAEGSGGFSNEYRLGNNYKIGTAKLSVDQVIWQKGKVSSSIEEWRSISQASNASLESRKQEISLSVKITYYTSLQQLQLYQIAMGNVSKAALFLEYARERYKVGAGRKSDVLKAESDLAEAEFDREKYHNSVRQMVHELAMLTGIPADKLSKLDDTYQHNRFMDQTDSLVALAFQCYPELQVTNHLKSSQQARIKEANADLYPRLSANAGYDWSYNPIVQDQNGWYAVLALRWNLFSGNSKRYLLQSEKIRMNSYENQTDEIKQFLLKEVNNRMIGLNEAENQIDLTTKLIKTTSENLEIAKAQYEAGTGSMLELTDARIEDLSARQKNVLAITAFRIAQAYLERLTRYNDKNLKP